MESNPNQSRSKSRRRSYRPRSGPRQTESTSNLPTVSRQEPEKDTSQSSTQGSINTMPYRTGNSSRRHNRRNPNYRPPAPPDNRVGTQKPSPKPPAQHQPSVSVNTVSPGNSIKPPDRTYNDRWMDKRIRIEETYDDIRKENERIEKEIWLEIAEIHNMKLD